MKESGAATRRGVTYWGPVLTAAGLVGIAVWLLVAYGQSGYWFLGASVLVALVGVVLIGYARQR